jgi:WD40 repeat protein
VVALAFSADGGTLAAVHGHPFTTLPGTLVLYDLPPGSRTAPSTVAGGGRCIAFAPAGRTLAVGVRDRIRILDLDSGQDTVPPLETPSVVCSLAFSPNGRALVSAEAPGAVRLWDLGTGRLAAVLGQHEGGGVRVAFSPDGGTIASAGGRVVRFWDARRGGERAAFRWHAVEVRALAFSPDGAWLASAGSDDLVKLWPWRTLLGLS